MKRLLGRRVILTGTQEGSELAPTLAQQLGQLLCSEGAEVLGVPLMTFEPTSQPQVVQHRLQHLQGFSWLLLTSPQAVRALIHELRALELGTQSLRHLRLAAVGRGTAQRLGEWGRPPDFVPSKATAQHLAAELPLTTGERVLHLTSQLAEHTLTQTLSRRGAVVERLELYRTVPRQLSRLELEALRGADVTVVLSGSAARQLASVAGTSGMVAAIGAPTAQAARQAGFEWVTQAQEASAAGLLGAVVEGIRSRRSMD